MAGTSAELTPTRGAKEQGMGRVIDREDFDDEDYQRFSMRLQHCLIALRELLTRPDFGVGEKAVGAELELALVDSAARPLPVNLEVLDHTVDPRVTVELNRFTMECNLTPTPLAGKPFSVLGREMNDALEEVRRAASSYGGRIAVTGILPTLLPEDLQTSAMTDHPRYRALSKALRRMRQEPFQVVIDGAEPLEIECDDVTFEGAATSQQLHLRVNPADFAGLFNAAQIATAPVLSAAGNSPTFLGRQLWEETRVALFKQAVDDRDERDRRARRVARVSFGTGWVVEGAWELFAQAIALHEVLLPLTSEEDPLACAMAGRVPALEEVRLHQGTVWSWNRPVYDPVGGGHLRIEMRALPAGPTTLDMIANQAFLIGLTLGLAPRIDALISELSFTQAKNNFYRAAQYGLEADIAWPGGEGGSVERVPADRLVHRLLPVAHAGLTGAGVDAEEADRLLTVISERCTRRQTGAVWQRRVLGDLDSRFDRNRALAVMLERYMTLSEGGEPVHTWPLEV
jgi:gamma-glutamyl:cysteine ligase YbdK (ATP-grasp superfamily)